MWTGGSAHETRVIAHRGDWSEFPENTLESFEQALRVGADMIELDVRRTADARLIAYHDAAVSGVPVARLRHDELVAKGGDAKPPLIEEVVEQMGGRIPLNLEFKERGCVREAVGLLRRAGVEDCLLTSFLDDVVKEAKAQAPEFPAGLVVHHATTAPPVLRAGQLGADCLVAELGRVGAILADAASAEVPCLVWTVNDPAAIERFLLEAAVIGLITDRPGLALERRSLLSGRTAPEAQR